MNVSKQTEEIHEEVLNALNNPNLDSEERKKAIEDLESVEEELENIRNKNFIQYLDAYIHSEPDTKILCSCNNSMCELKRGNIPPKLVVKRSTKEQSTKDIAEEWILEHDGGDVIREALQNYSNRESELRKELRKILSNIQ